MLDKMMGFMSKAKGAAKPKNRVGLDIGTHSIKIAEIVAGPNKPTLSALGMKKIAGLSRDGIATSIKALADEARISQKEVNISVSGPSVIVRFMSMPKMSDEDLRSAIKFEAEKFIPFNINDCIVDFQVLKRGDKDNKIGILLAATKKDHITEKIGLVEAAGLSVVVVDCDSFALSNTFFKNFPDLGPEKTIALLNIGATFTNLSILRGDAISFSRDIAIGGNDFDTAIAKNLGIDTKSAEDMKLSPADRAQEVSACIKVPVSNLLDEVKLSFSYHENQSGRSIDEVYVSGGESDIPGLSEAFQEAISSKPLLWDPLSFLDKPAGKIDSGLAGSAKSSFPVAVGLALR